MARVACVKFYITFDLDQYRQAHQVDKSITNADAAKEARLSMGEYARQAMVQWMHDNGVDAK